MNSTNLPYESYLYIADDWDIYDDEHFLVRCPGIPAVPSGELLVPVSLFENDHPMLPAAVRALIKWSHDDNKSKVDSNSIVHTSDVLHGRYIKFSETFTESTKYTYLFGYVESARILDHDPSTVNIVGEYYDISSTDQNNQSVPFVTKRWSGDFYFEKTDIDQRFPGWERRLQLGKELSVEMQELMTHVFKTAAAVSADLPDMELLSSEPPF